MEEPQRSIVQRNFDAFKTGWEASLDRTRENLKLGSDPLDIMAAEGALLYGQEGMTAENLAFFIAAAMVYEAQRTPRSRGAAKKAVPAKRKPRKAATTLQDVEDARAINAEVMEHLTGPIEHGPHPLEDENA